MELLRGYNIRVIKKITLLLLGLSTIISGQFKIQGPHDFKGKCDLCHDALNDAAILVQKSNQKCITCHAEFVKQSHPTEVIAIKKIPDQFPLFQGKIVCNTCHLPHKKYGTGIAWGTMEILEPHLLRAKNQNKTFCYNCHRPDIERSKEYFHALALRKAHPISLSPGVTQEDNSRECLSCHDGIITNTLIGLRENSSMSSKRIHLSHPIEIDYEMAYLKRSREYYPWMWLNPKIKLVNKKVACETCHNLYSKLKNHLVMDNFRSRLCLSCHKK